MNIRKINKMLLVMIIAILTTGTNISANVNNNYLGEFSNKRKLIQFFQKNHVPSEKQQILIDKLKNGILWDCYNQEKIKLIPENFYYLDMKDNGKEKYFRFEDGSFIKVSIGGERKVENHNEDISRRKINNSYVITDSYGSLYVNYKVMKQVGSLKVWFYANFYVARPGFGFSKIYTYENSNGIYSEPYGENIKGFGVVTMTHREMIREVEYPSTDQSAMFRLTWCNQRNIGSEWVSSNDRGESISIGSYSLYLAIIRGHVYIDSKLPF